MRPSLRPRGWCSRASTVASSSRVGSVFSTGCGDVPLQQKSIGKAGSPLYSIPRCLQWARRAGPERSLHQQFFSTSSGRASSPASAIHIRADATRRDVPALCRSRPNLQSRCPAYPGPYQFDPVQTTKTSVHGAINMLGLAKRVKARILQASTSEVYGDPEDASSDRELLGPRQLHRVPQLLRRGQALRRDACFRLSAPACARYQGHPHIQHLRTAHASKRRPRGQQFHRPGSAGEDSRIYGEGLRPAHFAMSTISSRG